MANTVPARPLAPPCLGVGALPGSTSDLQQIEGHTLLQGGVAAPWLAKGTVRRRARIASQEPE